MTIETTARVAVGTGVEVAGGNKFMALFRWQDPPELRLEMRETGVEEFEELAQVFGLIIKKGEEFK